MKLEDLKKLLLLNPVTTLLWGLVSEWYIIVICAGLIVLFWTYKALDNLGIIDKAQTGLVQILTDSKNMAKYCFPLMNDMPKLWDCAKDLEKYRQIDEETNETVKAINKMEKELEKMMPHRIMQQPKTPYDN